QARPGLVTTVGQNEIGQEKALVTMIKGACAKQVGAGKPCNVSFMIGLSNFPTDVLRINYVKKAFSSGPIKVDVMPQGNYDPSSAQKVALTYFGANKNVDVFATFADQMTQGVLVAFKQLGITPGKTMQVVSYGNTKEIVTKIKNGQVYAAGAYYPSRESTLGIRLLVQALQGKKVPNLVNVITPGTP